MEAIRAHFQDRLAYLTFSGGLRPFTKEPMEDAFRLKLAGIYAQISAVSGQPFGETPSMEEGFIYDTEPASRAVVTMRHIASGEEYPYMLTIQRAFYAGGEDITQSAILARHAEGFGVTQAQFLQAFQSAEMAEATLADFRVAQQFEIDGFPTLLIHRQNGAGDNRLLMVGKGYAEASDIIERIEAALVAEV